MTVSQKMFVKYNSLNRLDLFLHIILVVLINRVPDQRLGRKCSRLDDTFEGNRVSSKAKIFKCHFLFK